MLERKDIREAIRRMELAAQESDQAAQEAREQLARVEVLLSRLEEWRRPLTKKSCAATKRPPRSFACGLTPATTQRGRDAPRPAIAG